MKKEKKNKVSKEISYKSEMQFTYNNLKELLISGRNTQRYIYLVFIILIFIEQLYFFITIKQVNVSFPLVGLLLSAYVLYFDLNKLEYKRQLASNNNKEITQVIELTSNNIILSNKDLKGSYTFDYPDVRKVYETKTSINIILLKNLGISFPKADYSDEEVEKIKKLLEEKCNLNKKIKMIHPLPTNIFWCTLVMNAILMVLTLIF